MKKMIKSMRLFSAFGMLVAVSLSALAEPVVRNETMGTIEAEGFVKGTLVKTLEGYVPIEDLSVGNLVLSCDFDGHCLERRVTQTQNEKADHYIKIYVGDEEIRMGFSGKLFSGDSWLNATSALNVRGLMNANYQSVLLDGAEAVEEQVVLYSLSVEEFENYFVSTEDILVHNHTKAEGDAALATGSPRDRAQVLIMEQFQKQKFTNPMQLAYIMATAEHETGNFRSMKEIQGEKKKYAPWYGRGYPQLTHKENYEKYTKLLGIDLMANPDLMLQEDVSAAVIVDGMMHGVFTGAKLSKFIDDNGKCDFVEARKTVNWIDKAEHIAGLARQWAAYFRKHRHSQYAAILGWFKWHPAHNNC